MRTKIVCILCLLMSPFLWAQYQFSGKVNEEHLDGRIYLSVVEDYRKISGVYPEQILAETQADSTGHFRFSGNNLPDENRIYRIHIDNCDEEEERLNHFTGHCPNSKEIVFVANNATTLLLPFSFENEMFCEVVSKNEQSKALLKIDSLKSDMRFAFGTYRSEANRKLNSKKWFSILQQYGEQLQEPLAELYSYAFLSDRSNELYGYYLEDLKKNTYYDNLLVRLQEKYPESPYTEQYAAELQSDRYLIAQHAKSSLPWWFWLLGGVLSVSLLGNYYFFRKNRKLQQKEVGKSHLTQQENKVLELILQDKSNKEIASQLFVSVSTVKTHINNVYKKLNVSSRDEVKKKLA
ncbi:helix-turn-helix transcriptional regulator [Aureisphaera galaxeae]|uniref:helix-turn-helix domain-containing protein n=1 Tax=Aureisphaera galaxeae TaxID=1538023 RepID=UPI0023503C85|nr:helix-turn-helix transcriptional regulator [Aureisphaera galaxeae]MDC8005700.1 helix-turn-helix transcriptional regulator [Aureisphaera galaxeae]